MRKTTFAVLIFLILAIGKRAQAQETAPVDSAAVETRSEVKKDSTRAPEPAVFEPFDFKRAPGRVLSDSLFRWHYGNDFQEILARRPGWISSRMYGIGRPADLQFRGAAQQDRMVFWDGMALNNPYTGAAELSDLPLNLLKSVQFLPAQEVFDFSTLTFSVAKPRSDFTFEQAANEYRILSALHSQNVSPNTNITGFGTGKKESSYYEKSASERFQAGVLVYHQFSNRIFWRSAFIRNRVAFDQPDGYAISDVAAYGFDPYEAASQDSDGLSINRNTWLKSDVFVKSVSGNVVFSAGIFSHNAGRNWTGSRDSVNYEVKERGISSRIQHEMDWFRTDFRGSVSIVQFENDSTSGNEATQQLFGHVESKTRIPVQLGIALFANGSGRTSGQFSVQTNISGSSGWEVSPFFRAETESPTLQDRFHQSRLFSGNAALELSGLLKTGTHVGYTRGIWQLSAEAGMLRAVNERSLSSDSLLIQIPERNGFFGSARVSMNAPRYVLHLSADWNKSSMQTGAGFSDNFTDHKLWLRSDFSYRDYFFNKATFAVLGVRTLLSPFAYQTPSYVVALDRWMIPQIPDEIPGFFRADVYVQARVRQLFLYYQIENVLNGIGQAGYFETVNYPMPPRFSRFGIRWMIRN